MEKLLISDTLEISGEIIGDLNSRKTIRIKCPNCKRWFVKIKNVYYIDNLQRTCNYCRHVIRVRFDDIKDWVVSDTGMVNKKLDITLINGDKKESDDPIESRMINLLSKWNELARKIMLDYGFDYTKSDTYSTRRKGKHSGHEFTINLKIIPQIEFNSRLKETYGMYYYVCKISIATKLLLVYDNNTQANLTFLHEFAHHLCRFKYEQRVYHGKEFKETYEELKLKYLEVLIEK